MNKMILGFLIGVVVSILGAGVGAYVVLTSGIVPARQDEPPIPIEKWAARTSLKATLKREATEQSPIPANEENLSAGATVYEQNCSGCHGTPSNPDPAFAKGFSPGPTLFAHDDVTDDPEGVIYWKAKHGIRFTGMPAFSPMLKDKEIWQVALFLKNMDKLPAPVEEHWKAMK